MPNDGVNADEFAENMELRALLKAFKLDDTFDPYRVIRTPSEDRTRDTVTVTFRMSKHLHREITKLYGPGRRFENRTEFLLHYCAVAFKIERALSAEDDAIRSLLDPAIARLDGENAIIEQQNMDKVIAMGRAHITNSDRTIRERMRIDLQRMRRICEDHDDFDRLRTIDDILQGR